MTVIPSSHPLVRVCTLSLAVLAHTVAIAQNAPSTARPKSMEDAVNLDSVSVTGTFVRGVAPVGTNVVDISRTDITAQGAVSTNDLMASIPQISNFNTLPRGGAGFGQPIVQTNLRNLGASGGTTTLVLMNNHRLVGAGILQTYVDPSIIPPGVIERVEVIPDGGSSIYGSDAIGGVINFITRREFDGTAVNVRHGWADNYTTLDFDFTTGAAWTGGSAVFSYAYTEHDNVLGIDRDYNRQDHTARGGTDFRTSACSPGNVQVSGVFHALPGRVPGAINLCDANDYVDLYPEETRHSLFGTIRHALTDRLELSADVYHSIRETDVLSAQFSSNVNITSANPYFQSIGGETSHMVQLSYRDAFGNSSLAAQRFVSSGLIPSLTWRGDNWQVKGTLNIGRSSNKINEHILNVAEENAAVAATTIETALNPYNPANTNRAVLDRINNFQDRFSADQSIHNVRVVADGALFKISGGEIKAAIGTEYHLEGLKAWITSGPDGAPLTASSNVSRHAISIFGELNVWTRATDDAKRPVMVWLHGGAFSSGAPGRPTYHGHHFAEHGVVLVSISHRLNVFGYTQLPDTWGEEYASSGLAGMLDIVEALKWVRANIEKFGGDPNNVTIFGESDGGAKVSLLLAMPAAQGLFHKAIIQSGAALNAASRAYAQALGGALLDGLGITPRDVEALAALETETIFNAQQAAMQRVEELAIKDGFLVDGFVPSVDGMHLPRAPFMPDAPEISRHIPLLIGTNKDENTLFLAGIPGFGAQDEADFEVAVHAFHPLHAPRLITALRAAHSGYSSAHLISAAASIRMFWRDTLTLAERKLDQQSAPVYMYLLTFETPVNDGMFKSTHTLDLSLIFGTYDDDDSIRRFVGPAENAAQISAQMQPAWIAFAITGNPNVPGILPPWPTYDTHQRPVMVFDMNSSVENDPYAALRKLMR